MDTKEQARQFIEWLCDGDLRVEQRKTWTLGSLVNLGSWANEAEAVRA